MVLLHVTAAVLGLGFKLDSGGLCVILGFGGFCEVFRSLIVEIIGAVVVVIELLVFGVVVGLVVELVGDVVNVVDIGSSCFSIDVSAAGCGSFVSVDVFFLSASPVLLLLGILVPFPAGVLFFVEGEVEGDGVVSHKDCAINSAKRGTSKAVI